MTTSRISAVILDWAGTTVDYGSRAPTQVFIEIFRARGVEITAEEARGPMGRAKHEHIAMVAALPRVAQRWAEVHGQPPGEPDVLAMYHDFLPLQKRLLSERSDVIPGIPEAVRELRSLGVRIGSSTGYTRELMDVVVPAAAAQGYSPDVVVCADEVPAGRPAPWMNQRVAALLEVTSPDEVLVVDDTLVGIEAGQRAGMKTVGVTMTGNELGLSQDEAERLSPAELQQRLDEVSQRFRSAGADFLLRSVAELPALVRSLTTEVGDRC